MAAFRASSLYREPTPHPLPPAAGKDGGGRGRAGGLPRPLRHPSGGRGSVPVTARVWRVGATVGGGPAGPEIGCCRPTGPYPRSLLASLSLSGASTGEGWEAWYPASRRSRVEVRMD